MNDPTALDYWTLAIAILAAITGVAALTTQVWSFALSGPRVKVALSSSLSTNTMQWLLGLEAYNVGRLPVTITSVGVTFTVTGEWRPKKRKKQIPAGLAGQGLAYGTTGPHRLVDGESENWLFNPGPIAHTVREAGGGRKVRAFVNLANGKTVHSRKRFDIVRLASYE